MEMSKLEKSNLIPPAVLLVFLSYFSSPQMKSSFFTHAFILPFSSRLPGKFEGRKDVLLSECLVKPKFS
jgi:hypothetical protein